jgi:hypothetical protein
LPERRKHFGGIIAAAVINENKIHLVTFEESAELRDWEAAPFVVTGYDNEDFSH